MLSFLLVVCLPLLAFSCGEYAHLFTEEEYALIASKRVRKEVRDMDIEDWNEIADAFWIMKEYSEEEGQKIYGEDYRNYDDLVCKHMIAIADVRGDQAHYTPGFMLYHRSLVLECEKSVLAIKPSLVEKKVGMPYFSLVEDMKLDDWRTSDLFSSDYFGSLNGNPDENHIITDGPFAYFPIQYIRDIPDHACANLHNTYGYLRSAVGVTKTKYLTRYGGSFCDGDLDPIQPEYYEICPFSKNMIEWHDCQKDAIHGPVHLSIGGTTSLYPGQPIYEPSEELLCTDFPCDTCTNWYFGLFIDKISYNYLTPEFKCLYCNETCDVDDPEDTVLKCQCYHGENVVNNTCTIQNKTGLFIDRDKTHISGDFSDVGSSPNDPLWWSHHPRIDMNLYRMNLRNYDSNPYFGFPENGDENGYGYGSNLDDILGSTAPFTRLFSELPDDKELSYRDILEQTQILKCDYTYDVILDEINPYCDDENDSSDDENDSNDDEDNEENIETKIKKKNKYRMNPFLLL